MLNEYRVTLDAYNGPLDLLLFLIRRDEVDIYDIPIARVTEQYIEYVEVLRELDPEAIGEFLVLAATLMEIKSRMLLPTPPPEEVEEDLSDPRLELVRQLLEYKRFKDAARSLEQSAAERALRHPRHPVLPPRDPDDIEIDNLEIWDLFDAFNRLLEQTGRRQAVHEVGVDDTPIALHADDIVDALEHAGGVRRFTELFEGRPRAEMIGLFLALLELIKRRRVRASQDKPSEPILLHLLEVEPEDEMGEAFDEEDDEYDDANEIARRIADTAAAGTDSTVAVVAAGVDGAQVGRVGPAEPADEADVVDAVDDVPDSTDTETETGDAAPDTAPDAATDIPERTSEPHHDTQ